MGSVSMSSRDRWTCARCTEEERVGLLVMHQF